MKVSYLNRLRQKKCAWDHFRVEALAEAQSVAWDSVPLGREVSSNPPTLFPIPILFTTLVPSFLPPPSPPFYHPRPLLSSSRKKGDRQQRMMSPPPLLCAFQPSHTQTITLPTPSPPPSAKVSRSRFFTSSLTENNIPSHTQARPHLLRTLCLHTSHPLQLATTR